MTISSDDPVLNRTVRGLLRRPPAVNRTVYVRPHGCVTQQEQSAWMRAVREVEPDVLISQMRGIDTFCCVECGTEPTYELRCSRCIAFEVPDAR